MAYGGQIKCWCVSKASVCLAEDVKADAQRVDVDHNPQLEARKERKERVAKNEKQRLANLARASGTPSQASRKEDIDRTLATSRSSTASMGKFDKKLEGEKKLRGVKRKVRPTTL